MNDFNLAELIMAVDDRFGVTLPALTDSRSTTVGDLWRAVVQHRTGHEPPDGAPPALDPTWREIVRFVAIHTERPVDDVRWDATLFGRVRR
jgi:hypothetical protein